MIVTQGNRYLIDGPVTLDDVTLSRYERRVLVR